MPTRRPAGEFALIERLFAPLTDGRPGALGLKDDAALLSLDPDRVLVVTKDLIVEGVHYLEDEAPERIAQRLLRVNLSDLAAMGADARCYALGLALPNSVTAAWLEAFTGGLRADQDLFGVSVIGGDTVSTRGPAVLSLTAFGDVPAGAALIRGGAAAGEDVYVSGTIGDAALGLRAARGTLGTIGTEDRAALEARYRLPEPRLALGRALRGLARGVMDVSDGLVADLGHICAASGVAARIASADVPLSGAAARALGAGAVTIEEVLTGGDDYELLFSAPPEARPRVAALAETLVLPLTRIGTIEAGSGVTVLDRAGRSLSLKRAGYAHF